MTADSDTTFDQEIDRFVAELEPPIRRKNEAVFLRMIDGLIQRAQVRGDEGEKDRLISHGQAIRQQWIPLAIQDDVYTAWVTALNSLSERFSRRYNLFVEHKIDQNARDRWAQLWNHYQRVLSYSRRISEWDHVKTVTVTPLLDRAKRDVPETGQFAPLAEHEFSELQEIYASLNNSVRRFHRSLLSGLAMQQKWMTEWGYSEPAAESDAQEPTQDSR